MFYKNIYASLFFSILASCIICQTNPDTLTIRSVITEEYTDYLTEKETIWWEQIENFSFLDDSPETMNAHMGLAFMQIAWAHVNGDSTITKLEPMLENLDDHMRALNSYFENEVMPAISEIEFIDLFFDDSYEPDIYGFNDALKVLVDNITNELEDFIFPTIETYIDSLDDNNVWYQGENLELDHHLSMVKQGTADFTFYLEIEAHDTMIFNRAFFNNQKALDQFNFDWNSAMDDGFDCLDQYYNLHYQDENNFDTCISHFRRGINYGVEWCNTLETIISNEPIVAFDIDTDFIDDLRSILDDIDELLSGKEYDIGPSSEQKTIKPINILRALQHGLTTEFNGFYYSENPNVYNFGGIFPYGLNQHVINQISADAVIYQDYNENYNENNSDMDSMDRWIELKADWQTLVEGGPNDPDPHMGLAYIKTLQLLDSTFEKLDDTFDYLDESRVDLFYDSWRDIDISDELDEIEDHLKYFIDAGDAMFIVLVIIDDYETGASHDIQSSTEFYAIPFHSINAEMVLNIADGMINGIQGISDISNEFYSNIDNMIDIDLNPNYLDFSEIENDLALINILKQSNPNWLSVTPKGRKWFHDTGEVLEDAFEEIHSFFVQLDDSLQNKHSQLLENDFDSVKDFSLELYNDFASPIQSTSTEINGENINLSAWFDYPPPSFLTLWENVVLDNDSPDHSMHCLFPGRSTNLNCGAECYGIATLDECGICAGDGVEQECGCGSPGEFGIPDGNCDCDGNIVDCAGECGGSSEVDECGVCGGSGILDGECDCDGNVEDCAGECGGSSEVDECGVCGGSGILDSECDCDGNIVDCAGECDGSDLSCWSIDEELVGIWNYIASETYPNAECGTDGSDPLEEWECEETGNQYNTEGECINNCDGECYDESGGGPDIVILNDDGTASFEFDSGEPCTEDADCEELGEGAEDEGGAFSCGEETATCIITYTNNSWGTLDGELCFYLNDEDVECVGAYMVENEILTIYEIDDHDGEVECDILIFESGGPLAIYNGIIPDQYSIHNIYPNPFNPVANITYGLPEYTKVKIIIYDLSGKQVQSLVNGIQGPGYHSVVWNADKYSSGMYLLRMYANGSTSGQYVSTQKILLIK